MVIVIAYRRAHIDADIGRLVTWQDDRDGPAITQAGALQPRFVPRVN
jgi:hypothetical protein